MIKLFELTGEDEKRRFSPYCWRVLMSLVHKSLVFQRIPWHFTEKDKIKFSGQGSVPVLVDGDNVVCDSWEIAKYLEAEYPYVPSLRVESGEVLFIKFWTERVLHKELLKFLLLDIHNCLAEKDKAYFRSSREKLFGKTLEEIVKNREERLIKFQKILLPIRETLKIHKFLAGVNPGFSDYIVFGAFQWARCVSKFSLLNEQDPIYRWRERMLDIYDGFARDALGYSV